MGKFVNAIIGATLIAVGAITGNPQIAIAGASLLAQSALNLLFGPKARKPDATERQQKNPVSPRVYGYGTRRVYGNLDLWLTASDGSTVDVISYVDGKAHAVRQVYLNDEKVTITGGVVQALSDGAYAGGVVQAGYNLGPTPNTAHAAVVSKLPGIWTTAHRGDGVVSGYVIKAPVKSKEYLKTYPQGDNVEMSLVIDLQLCFDPREAGHDIDDDSTWQWTENPVLHLLHYFIVRRGYDYTTRILPQIDKWIAAADVCDETMTLNAGGTEPRYRACILYDSQAKPHEVIASIIETFDGWYYINERNEVEIYAGVYTTPTVTLGPDHIVEYSHQANVIDEDVYNEIKIKYFSAAHDYNQPECQEWRDEDDISKRGLNSTGIEPQIPSYTQGRRLAKALMARQNANDRGQITTNYSGRIAAGQRFINLNLVEAGLTLYSGPVEIQKVMRNRTTGGLTIDWVRATPTAYDWNPATEDGYGAPVGDFPTLDPVDTPEITSAISVLASDGSSAQVAVTVDAPDRSDLTWFGRWKLSADSVWSETEYTDIAAGSSVALLIGLVPLNASIDVAVAYQLGDGRLSAWSDTETVSTSTANLAPASPTELSATGGAGEAEVTWRNPASSNLSYVRLFRSTTDDFGTSSDISGELVGGLGQVMSVTDDSLAAGTYYYWTVAYNASDVASAPAGSASATVT